MTASTRGGTFAASLMNHWRRLGRRDLPSLLRRAEGLTAAGEWARAGRVWGRLARRGLRGGQGAADAGLGATAWAEYGRCCLQLRRLADAHAALGRALELEPGHPLANKLLGWVAAEQEDWPLAAAQWRGILEAVDDAAGTEGSANGDGTAGPASAASPANPAELAEAIGKLVNALIHLGEFAEAEALLERMAAIPGDDGAAERQALQLGVDMATVRMDFDGMRQAWERLNEKYPEAARKVPGWRRLAGLPDYAEEWRYRPDDLRRAKDAAAARRILGYLTRLPRQEHLALSREALAAFPSLKTEAGMLLHWDYIRALLMGAANAAEFEDLQRRVRAFCKRYPRKPRSQGLRMDAAIAANDAETVAALLPAVKARLGEHVQALRLELWLAAKRGDHAAAYRINRQLARRGYILAEDRRGLDLRPLNGAPVDAEWKRKQDRILLFTNFRNERLFAPWFLDYYRGLGVERFFIVDNLSNDGTADYLAAQKDVTAFASADSYAAARTGVRWINELIRRYGQDNWCLLLDSDEELVLPFPRHSRASGNPENKAETLRLDSPGLGNKRRGNDGGSSASPLRRFVDGMAARGEEVLPAFMLDTFPGDLGAVKDFQPGDAPLAVSALIDSDYFFSGNILCPFLRVKGGVRDRLFGRHEIFEKAPILRGGPGPCGGQRLYTDNHKINYARPSPRRAALLHHKLLREALDLQQGEAAAAYRVGNRDRWCQQRHDGYRGSGYLDPSGPGIPRSPATVAYEGPAQLQRLGLLGSAGK